MKYQMCVGVGSSIIPRKENTRISTVSMHWLSTTRQTSMTIQNTDFGNQINMINLINSLDVSCEWYGVTGPQRKVLLLLAVTALTAVTLLTLIIPGHYCQSSEGTSRVCLDALPGCEPRRCAVVEQTRLSQRKSTAVKTLGAALEEDSVMVALCASLASQ